MAVAEAISTLRRSGTKVHIGAGINAGRYAIKPRGRRSWRWIDAADLIAAADARERTRDSARIIIVTH